MGISRKSWFGILRKKFLQASPRRETNIVLHASDTLASSSFTEEPTTREEEQEKEEEADDIVVIDRYTNINAQSSPATQKPEDDMLMSAEDIAATKIQAYFRSHLARRAYRALRSLVKLQAVVRGVLVRRQAHLALECMHALARLQVTVRARQLLDNWSPTH